MKIGNVKIAYRKNAEIPVEYVQFLESFRRKMDFSVRKNVDIFEKWIHLLIL